MIRDTELNIALDNDVFGKGPILSLHGIGSMRESADPIALLERLLDVLADLLDDTRVVAADEDTGGSKVLNVLPISGVNGDTDGFHEDIVVAEGREGAVCEGGLFRRGDSDDFLRHCGGFGRV